MWESTSPEIILLPNHNIPEVNLTFHHTGIAVDAIDETAEHYAALFGKENISEKIHIASQQVNVCFVKTGENIYLELVEAASEGSPVTRMRKKGHTYYHTAYLAADIENTVAQMEALHYKPMDYFYSEAFGGKRCIFLYTPDAQLIELIEK